MIVLYIGSRGKAKTLSMVKDSYKYFKNGYRIIRNFHMEFGEYMSNEQILALDKNSGLRDCVLVIDEIQILFDSRDFGTKSNKKFSNYLQQIRKRNVKVLCTTQYLNAVEKRLRQHLDIVAMPDIDRETGLCMVAYIDITTLEDSFLDPVEPHKVVVCYNAKPFYGLYDTYEMIV